MPNLLEATVIALQVQWRKVLGAVIFDNDHNQFRAYEPHYVTKLVAVYDQVAVNPVGG